MATAAGVKVKLQVVEGPLAGREFVYDTHDVLLMGRDSACHVSLPNEPFVSRHHFAIEINPPRVSLRDLNSLNGTTVNGIRFGGRMYKGETGAAFTLTALRVQLPRVRERFGHLTGRITSISDSAVTLSTGEGRTVTATITSETKKLPSAATFAVMSTLLANACAPVPLAGEAPAT